MKVDEMKIIDVIEHKRFIYYVGVVLSEIDRARNDRDMFKQYKRNVVDRLKERGIWNKDSIKLLYIEVLEKRLEGYSSIERAAIEQLGDEAFSRTMKYLKEQEEKRWKQQRMKSKILANTRKLRKNRNHCEY